MKNLIIVESPTKAKTLSKFLGEDYSVEATMGHIKDLPKSKLAVDLENNFEPLYEPVAKKKDSISLITKSAKKAGKVLIATDPDREGEAIAQHVKEIVKGIKPVRIVFHEITKSAVEEAISSPREIDKNLVDAQIARRVLDRLVGYKLSPLLWKKVRRGLSAGRVQSVAVRLIVEREREIKDFKAEEFWEIGCEVTKEDKKFFISLARVNDKKIEVTEAKTAAEIVKELEKASYRVSDVIKKEVRKNPYPPFTTSTMTQAAANLLGWSAKRTMSIAQKIYEEGFITYHRTDSTNVAKSAIEGVRTFIEKEFGKDYLPETLRFYKTKAKVAQEAHEAVRPTKLIKEVEISGTMQKDAQRLYDLIWKKFVASQMEASVYDKTLIEVVADEKYLLRASGEVMKFDGWRKVSPAKSVNGEQILPEVSKGDSLSLLKVLSEQKFTQPPARFNEASLIKTLEKLGIGRPSTYAPIISTIQERQYVEKDEGKFFPTPVGFAVNDFLIGNFPEVFEYSFTAEMEEGLDSVANGETEWQKMMKKFWGPFSKDLTSVEKKAKRVKIETEKLGKKCPTCKEGELVIRIGRFGKFISCSRFPECKHTEKFIDKVGMKCPECKKGEVVIKKTRKGRKFFGCSRYPDCEWASWKKPGESNGEENFDKN